MASDNHECDELTSSGNSRLGADDRLRRLLAIVPWIVSNDGPTLGDVCDRFPISQDELIADLDLLFLCGVYPFTPDTLMEVVIEDGRVWINYADVFSRPLRLTPEEGLFLIASGATLMTATGADENGPLARGLLKLAEVLGVEMGDSIDVNLGSASHETLTTLREAVLDHRQVALDYYTYGRDQRTHRVVEPLKVFAAEGEWYLHAWCTLAEATRNFRVDRIRAIRVIDKRFEPRTPSVVDDVFRASDDDPRIVLDLAPPARWVIEQYPIEHCEELAEGHLKVRLVAAEDAWIERLMLRLGPLARVIEGDRNLGRRAAERVLDRYRDGERSSGR